jgi:hypothetical protein
MNPRETLEKSKSKFFSIHDADDAGRASGAIIRLKMYARRFFGEGNTYEAALDKIEFGWSGEASPTNAFQRERSLVLEIIDTMIEELRITAESNRLAGPEEQVEAYFVLHPAEEYQRLSPQEQAAANRGFQEWEDIIKAVAAKNEITSEEFNSLLAEMYRLQELLRSSTKGVVYRAMARLFNLAQVIKANPVTTGVVSKVMVDVVEYSIRHSDSAQKLLGP